jgi:hypothetical protein
MLEEMVASGYIAADYIVNNPLQDLYNLFVAWVESGIRWEILGSAG